MPLSPSGPRKDRQARRKSTGQGAFSPAAGRRVPKGRRPPGVSPAEGRAGRHAPRGGGGPGRGSAGPARQPGGLLGARDHAGPADAPCVRYDFRLIAPLVPDEDHPSGTSGKTQAGRRPETGWKQAGNRLAILAGDLREAIARRPQEATPASCADPIGAKREAARDRGRPTAERRADFRPCGERQRPGAHFPRGAQNGAARGGCARGRTGPGPAWTKTGLERDRPGSTKG